MVEYEIQGHVGVITLNRPEARNAIDGETALAIEHSIDRLEQDDDVWVGIVAGTGPVFCAGADLKAIAAGKVLELNTARGGFAGVTARARTKPLIAAVDGAALAGGTEIVLACDLVVASRAATFGIPEVKRALIAGAGGLFRLPRVLPRAVAMEMALTGDPITAERACGYGLVNALVERGEALTGALALAGRITANAPIAVRLSRMVLAASQTSHDADLWSLTAEAMATVLGTEDLTEGLSAFIEKRPPRWTGR